ncbi:MAG: cob(I)yrinic acid a,c-diamide adenosyltransferase [Actinomycetota bacterium]
MRIYTRKGDDGSTGLLYGGRVRKDDRRIQAGGALDEAVAALGLARSFVPKAAGLADLLLRIQRELFVAGAEIATLPENAGRLKGGVTKVTNGMVEALETEIDRVITEIGPLDGFIVPGATPVASSIDLGRAMVRRAERGLVALMGPETPTATWLQPYLNRLSDLLFMLARLEENANQVRAPGIRQSEGG